ncbi:oxidoreductase [Chimaeribacter californicus]|uniref:Oxidoreductase n=1 Tax=Chimaeribacter californicus TaxID=2060067 RepID=A0A2N5EDN4_9GAMM|nr:GNAT family N-acetyltransferase [Chimaeribacter californicus]PLR40649.1 oxidoreductase [Chimaeribacter californicus]
MSYHLSCHHQLAEINAQAYAALWRDCGQPAFYHPDLLAAAERHPLLPTLATYYLAAWQGERLEALLVVYQQSQPDPFGTLAKSTGFHFTAPPGGLLGHIAHCYDTQILHRPGSEDAAQRVMTELMVLAGRQGIPGCGLLNLSAGPSLSAAERAGYRCHFMHDRFFIDLMPFERFGDYLAALPRDGRHEMKRQLRKFDSDRGSYRVLPGRDADLAAAVKLCHATSARNGTPHYYPIPAFLHFLETCGDLITVVQVEHQGQLVAAAICLNDPQCLHLWAGGVDYRLSGFSPYTIMIAAGVQYAFSQRIRRIEMGRTNARIKARLGCRSQPLYSALFPREVA